MLAASLNMRMKVGKKRSHEFELSQHGDQMYSRCGDLSENVPTGSVI